jgi:outer membrane protein OmpA-like peptidoglycan-associated protein
MGGYDIFKSVMGPNGWSKPQNMGYPINSVGNDVSFSLSANGKIGYYSSTTSNGDKDIFTITFLGEEKKGILNTEDNLLAELTQPIEEKVIEPIVKVRSNKLTMLKGIISDANSSGPLNASIEIYDNEKNTSIVTIESNSITGKYLVSLPSGKNYGIFVKSNGYLFYSENFLVPSSADYQIIYKDIALNKMDIGSKVILKNIFFDTGKDSLRNESYAELTRLKKLLDDFPYLKIEISGHTDNVGNANYNQGLSERRAQSVVNYFEKEGINLERLNYLGYGFNQQIASNENAEGRQKNRRTEFKIIGTDYKPPKEKKPKQIKENTSYPVN